MPQATSDGWHERADALYREVQCLRTERWTWKRRVNWMLLGAFALASLNFVAKYLA